MPDKKPAEAVLAAMAEINDKYGDGSIIKMGDSKKVTDVEFWPTNCMSLDYVLGCGGVPRGRVLELFGAPSSGKSSASLYLAAQVQKTGGVVVWIDAEHCYTRKYAEEMGVNTDDIILCQPDSAEQAFDTMDAMAKANVDLIIVDSVAALVPQKEVEGDADTQTVALLARIMSKGLRKLTSVLSKSRTSIVFINQIRDTINTFGYGPKKSTPGGNALKFYSSIRLEVKKMKTHKQKDEVIGNLLKIEAVKNKVAPPFRSVLINFYFGRGFDLDGDLLTLGVKHGLIKKEGITYSYGETKLGAGEAKAALTIGADDKLKAKLKKELAPLVQ